MLLNVSTFIGDPNGSGFSLTAPVDLAFVSPTDPSNDNTQDVVMTLTAPEAGDEVVTNAKVGGFSTPNDPVEFDVQDVHQLTGPEIIALEVTRNLTLPDGANSVSAFHKRSTTYSNRSNVVTKTIDTTAPTLSSPTDTATGQTTADVGVTTNEANGTLYCVVTTSGTPPSAAQVKAGQDNSSVAATFADDLAIASTGVKAFSATGLTAATAYTAHFMHEDALGNQSAVSSGNGFTTDSAATAPVVAASANGTQTANSTVTASLPASISAGDLLILVITGVTNPAATTVTTPATWNVLGSDTQGFTRLAAFYKIALGTEGASVNVNFGATARYAFASYRITGHDALQAPEMLFALNSKDPPSLTPSWGSNNNLWIAGTGADSDSDTSTPTFPTGYASNQAHNSIAANGDGGRIALATKEATATSDDPSAYTIVGSSNVSFTIAVKPA